MPPAHRRLFGSTASSMKRPTAAWQPIADFIQMEPNGGQPASEKTEVWVFFDNDNVYVAMKAWESRPDLMVANEMRRDSNNIRMGDCVGFSLDTFHDGRNAYQFEVNPLGARTDGQSANERQYNSDWNPVWDLAVGKFRGRVDGGSRDPVQVAALPAGRRAGLGLQRAPQQQLEERDLVSRAHSAGVRHRPRQLCRLAVSNARRHRRAARIEEPRDQAVRDRRSDDRSRWRRRRSRTISMATSGST